MVERMTVIVTRRKRETLVPVLFYYSNDAEGPRRRSQPRSAGSYINIEMEGECLLPERWLAQQGSGANAREKKEGCLSSAVTREPSRHLWLYPARSSVTNFFPPPCAFTHELVFGERIVLWHRFEGPGFPCVGLSPR